MRTLRKTIILLFIICFIFNCFSIAHAENEVTVPNIPCDAYFLIDLDTGRVLAEKNPDKQIYPASTTKIMTSIVALENSELDKKMTASYEAVCDIGYGGMHIGILHGEVMEFKDLLNAVLLNSANEAANIIAENSAENRAAFIKLMNKKAKKIGAINTHYANCHGMFHEKHYTTARDLATISRYAMTQSPKSDIFSSVVAQESYTLPKTNKHKEWFGLKTTNGLRDFTSKYYDKVIGLKTGFINASGHNFIGCVEDKNGTRLLSVIAGVRTFDSQNSVFKYTKDLLEYGYKANTHFSIDIEKDVSKYNPIDSGFNSTEYVDYETSGTLQAFISKEDALQSDYGITSKFKPNKKLVLQAPLKKGTEVGKIKYFYKDTLLGEFPVVTDRDVGINFTVIRSYITLGFTAFVILILLYILNMTLKRSKKR